MESKLNFIETSTVEQFKDEQKVQEILLRKNAANGKLFITFGAKTGAVSSKGKPENPMISLVHETLTRKPTAEERKHIGATILQEDGTRVPDPGANGYFFLLHSEGKGAEIVCHL